MILDIDKSVVLYRLPALFIRREALAVLAFGISWFTKGEAILKEEVQLSE